MFTRQQVVRGGGFSIVSIPCFLMQELFLSSQSSGHFGVWLTNSVYEMIPFCSYSASGQKSDEFMSVFSQAFLTLCPNFYLTL